MLDGKYNQEYIDKKIIQNDMLLITENIVNSDGWKFLIDKNIPEIVSDLGKEDIIVISTPYVGTTSFTIEISYIENEEDIEEYIYMIDNIENASMIKEYTKEEFEAESSHTVKVIAKYKDGKMLESNIINVNLKPKIYLYNNGDICGEITGGWRAEAIGCGNANVKPVEPNLNIESDYMNVQLKSQSDKNFTGGRVVTNKTIDYSQYKKICFKYTATLTTYNAASAIQIKEKCGDEYKKIGALCYTKPVTQIREEKVNILQSDSIDNIYIYLQCDYSNAKVNANIYEIWLEK